MEENFSLRPFNTFGFAVNARYFVSCTGMKELQNLLISDLARNNPLFILGGGSNILLTEDFDGLVVKIDICGKEILEENEKEVVLGVGAGENWHQLVCFALENDWGGIENLSLIPGTVGAAPMQNIGAYGVEIKDVFDHLVAVNRKTGERRRFSGEECAFGYRESVFKKELKDKYVIARVAFRLNKPPHHLDVSYGAIRDTLREQHIETPTIQDVSRAVISIRQSKLPDPAKIGNSGSFFKNPTVENEIYEHIRQRYPDLPGYDVGNNQVKVPAGWLIEQCGWKGYERDGIGVHKNQALVLVNYGTGKGKDVLALAREIQDSVSGKFGIELLPEVNLM